MDEPSIDGIQTLLLLSQAMLQEGKSKKSHMYLGTTATQKANAMLTPHRICYRHGICTKPASRISEVYPSELKREKKQKAPVLGVLHHGAVRGLWFKTTLKDFGR
jgi:hypothetical protein